MSLETKYFEDLHRKAQRIHSIGMTFFKGGRKFGFTPYEIRQFVGSDKYARQSIANNNITWKETN